MLRDRTPEAVAVAGALGPERARRRRGAGSADVRHRSSRSRATTSSRPASPGPAVGDALEAAQLAALAGEAPGAAEQLAAGLAAVRPS